MNTHQNMSAMDFVVAELGASPSISFQELKTKAAAHGHVVFPVNYGRAKAMLGLLPAKAAATNESHPEATTVTEAPRRGRPISEAGKFVQDRLQAHPEATLEEVKNIAALSGITVSSGTYYQARSRLGIAKARGTTQAESSTPSPELSSADTEVEQGRVKAVSDAREPRPTPAGAGRASATTLDIESIAVAIRELEEERNALRECLSHIAAIVKRLS